MKPEIRFNGFSDEWGEKKLDQSEIRVATGKLNANAATTNGKYPFFTTALETYMTDSYSFDDDAILIAGNGNLGFVKEYNGKFDAYQREYVLTNFEGYAKSYLVSYFKHLLGEHISHSSKGSAMPYITKDVLESFLIAAPTLPEQQKIGSLFSKYDNIIALREQKLEELNALKKGLLQQMFDDGSATSHKPQVRFSGFNDEWVEKKLGDVTNRVTRKNKDNESNRILTISAEDGLVDQIEYFNKQIASRDLSGYFLMKNGEFAYNKSYSNGHPWGAIKRLDKYDTGVLSSLYIVFQPKNIDSQFLVAYYDTTAWHKGISMNATEGARNHGLLNIAPIDFFNTVLNIPLSPEQQKIGQLFKHLDARISNEQSKIEQLKAQKQGLLQKMIS